LKLKKPIKRVAATDEQIGEPDRELDRALNLKGIVPPSEVRLSFSHGRSKEVLMKKIAERLAKIAAGWEPPEPPDDDMEQDEGFY
jgi:hypothetical protein